jgi:hypothetical protein
MPAKRKPTRVLLAQANAFDHKAFIARATAMR